MSPGPLLLIATLLAPTWPAAPTARTSIGSLAVFQEIDARYRQGAIDAATRHRYRVLAIRHPSRLPGDLQALVPAGPTPGARRSGTTVLVEAFQYIAREGLHGSDLHLLLQPPDDFDYIVDSSILPLRVSYQDEYQLRYAETVLAAAEHSWNIQSKDFGFWVPPIESGTVRYRYYIGETGAGVAGYTAPYDGNPDTAWSDCFSYIFINPNLGDGVITTVAHEMNHAMQSAMDCNELITYMENTAVYIEGETYPERRYEGYWFIPSFQREPWKSLYYFQSGVGYPYGGVLWNYFLTDTYAPDDGPTFVREIWEACVQDNWQNEPDYFDAIEAVVGAWGGDASDIAEIYTDFAEARYFVSGNDDGQHISNAGEYWEAEPAVVARHPYIALPVFDEDPQVSLLPEPFGTNFVVVTLPPGNVRPLRVALQADEDTRWSARVLLVAEGLPTQSHVLALDPDTFNGELTVDPAGFDELVLVVANLGKSTHDPDIGSSPRGQYFYSIEPVIPPPTVLALYPATLPRGRQNLHVRLVGDGFVLGPDFTISFTDPLIHVESIDSGTATEVLFTVTVPVSANLGVHDVMVTNEGGAQGVGVDLLTVVATVDPIPEDGCCATGGSRSRDLPVVLLLLPLAYLALRRRRWG